jgi:hypothetical protein
MAKEFITCPNSGCGKTFEFDPENCDNYSGYTVIKMCTPAGINIQDIKKDLSSEKLIVCPYCGKEIVFAVKDDKICNIRLASLIETKNLDSLHEMIAKSPDTLDNASKSYIGLTTTLITVFIAIFGFLEFTNIITSNSIFISCIVIGFFLLILGLIGFAYVYKPNKYDINFDDTNTFKKLTNEISQSKYSKLRIGMIFFISGLIVLTFSFIIGSYFLYHTSDTSYEAKLLISPENSSIITDLGIYFIPGSNLTEPITIIAESPKLIIKKNETIIKVDPGIIKGILKINN